MHNVALIGVMVGIIGPTDAAYDRSKFDKSQLSI
jgi:hypothetical protein